MNASWNEAKARAQQIDGGTRPRRSERNGLTMVFEWAERKGMSHVAAEMACVAPISNLQTAVGELKRAVRWDDPATVERILRLCVAKTNADLRLALHTVMLEDVPVENVDGEVLVRLNPAQFAALKATMKLRHRYVEQQAEPLQLGYDFYQ